MVHSQALYSTNDTRKAEWHCRGSNVIFVCKVALGKFFTVDRKRPDLKAESVLTHYDSVCVNTTTTCFFGFFLGGGWDVPSREL